MTAHRLVQLAVAAGKLVRGPCEGCGAEKTDGHHDDYDKPLEVRWLCKVHHAARHREMRAQRRAGKPQPQRMAISFSDLARNGPPDEPVSVYRRNGDGTMTTVGLWFPMWLVDE